MSDRATDFDLEVTGRKQTAMILLLADDPQYR